MATLDTVLKHGQNNERLDTLSSKVNALKRRRDDIAAVKTSIKTCNNLYYDVINQIIRDTNTCLDD
ncbi:MAG: hypothetical protein FWG21_01275, partial [Oscillospiraceae bacterium]|nr:hypothetical protein [Oscillospiraceae bacterium]